MNIKYFIWAMICGAVIQGILAIDSRDITVQLNTTVPAGARFEPAYLLTVGQLKTAGNIETWQVTIQNASQEVIVIGPDLLVDVTAQSVETVGDILWKKARRANLMMSSLGVLGILCLCGWAVSSYFLGEKSLEEIWAPKYVKLGVITAGSLIALPALFTGIEKNLWHQASQSFLHEMVTVQPGQTVQKFVFVSASDAPAQVNLCKIRDMQNMVYTIPVSHISSH